MQDLNLGCYKVNEASDLFKMMNYWLKNWFQDTQLQPSVGHCIKVEENKYPIHDGVVKGYRKNWICSTTDSEGPQTRPPQSLQQRLIHNYYERQKQPKFISTSGNPPR